MKRLINVLIVFFMAAGLSVSAQQTETKISDAELQKFAKAYTAVQELNNETQQKMVKAIEDAGMTVERYTEIQQTQQAPDQASEIPEAELATFQKATTAVQAHQNDFQKNIEKKVTDAGMEMTRYQEIMAQVQSDPKLQEKIQEYL